MNEHEMLASKLACKERQKERESFIALLQFGLVNCTQNSITEDISTI